MSRFPRHPAPRHSRHFQRHRTFPPPIQRLPPRKNLCSERRHTPAPPHSHMTLCCFSTPRRRLSAKISAVKRRQRPFSGSIRNDRSPFYPPALFSWSSPHSICHCLLSENKNSSLNIICRFFSSLNIICGLFITIISYAASFHMERRNPFMAVTARLTIACPAMAGHFLRSASAGTWRQPQFSPADQAGLPC